VTADWSAVVTADWSAVVTADWDRLQVTDINKEGEISRHTGCTSILRYQIENSRISLKEVKNIVILGIFIRVS
jgi:hypothetical protein